jgi:hypothetical protein
LSKYPEGNIMSDDLDEKIRGRAYTIWEEEGGEHGRDREHWARAEQEVGSDGRSVTAPTQQAPAEGGDDTPAPLEGSPEE